ncbi:hypothetical protein ACIQU6_30755 [Streptomyces sp. NPDC090442]|uniref:hypothetical protein n=1 Tax=Streptomyces sp. NPDC090442 TaxID=3365962 RepID=UPI003817579A
MATTALKHNADPHVTFWGVQQGLNCYLTRNGVRSTQFAYASHQLAMDFLRHRVDPDAPKMPYQERWWEARNVHTGELLYTPERFTAPRKAT